MDRIKFGTVDDFLAAFTDIYRCLTQEDELNDVCVYAKYDEAKVIFNSLMADYDYDVYLSCLNTAHAQGYKDEFVLSLLDNEIYLEPAKYEDMYVIQECNEVFVLSNCNSKLLKYMRGENITEVYIEELFGEDEEYDNDYGITEISNCPHCSSARCKYLDRDDCCDEDENSHPEPKFSVNGKPATEKEYENAILEVRNIFAKYLSAYSDIVSEFKKDMKEIDDLFKW